MLMVLHLYLNLPSLIPKARVEFSGTLGRPVKKTIELRNLVRNLSSIRCSFRGVKISP